MIVSKLTIVSSHGIRKSELEMSGHTLLIGGNNASQLIAKGKAQGSRLDITAWVHNRIVCAKVRLWSGPFDRNIEARSMPRQWGYRDEDAYVNSNFSSLGIWPVLTNDR